MERGGIYEFLLNRLVLVVEKKWRWLTIAAGLIVLRFFADVVRLKIGRLKPSGPVIDPELYQMTTADNPSTTSKKTPTNEDSDTEYG